MPEPEERIRVPRRSRSRRRLVGLALAFAWLCGPGAEASHVFEHVVEHEAAHARGEAHHDSVDPVDGYGRASSDPGHDHVHPEELTAVSSKAPGPETISTLLDASRLEWPPAASVFQNVAVSVSPKSRGELSPSSPRAPPIL